MKGATVRGEPPGPPAAGCARLPTPPATRRLPPERERRFAERRQVWNRRQPERDNREWQRNRISWNLPQCRLQIDFRLPVVEEGSNVKGLGLDAHPLGIQQPEEIGSAFAVDGISDTAGFV